MESSSCSLVELWGGGEVGGEGGRQLIGFSFCLHLQLSPPPEMFASFQNSLLLTEERKLHRHSWAFYHSLLARRYSHSYWG